MISIQGFDQQLSKCSDNNPTFDGVNLQTDELIGEYENSEEENIPVFKGSSKYGPYIKVKEGSKWRFCSVSEEEYDTMDIKWQ